MTGQAWRVQPTEPPSLAVMVDAWETLALAAPSASTPRIDLVVEKDVDGGRALRVLTGSVCGRPVLPEGWSPLAVVHVGVCAPMILHCHIGDT